MPYETASSCHHKQVLRQLVLLSCILLLQALLGIAMDCLVEACRYADTCQPKHGLDKLRILHVACISVTSGRILELSRQIAALWCLQKPTSALLAPLYVHCSGCSTEHLGTQHNLLTTAQFTMAMLAVFKMGPPGKLTVAEYPWKNPCQLMNASPGTTLFQQLSWLDLKECLRGKLTAMEAYMHA